MDYTYNESINEGYVFACILDIHPSGNFDLEINQLIFMDLQVELILSSCIVLT
jgi:hypothetical protein